MTAAEAMEGLRSTLENGIDDLFRAFENETFTLLQWCDYCEDDQCRYCAGGEPNFLHKETGISVRWYKTPSHNTKINEGGILKSLDGYDWDRIFNECYDSIPESVREAARLDWEYQQTPQFQEQKKATLEAFIKILYSPQDIQHTPLYDTVTIERKQEPQANSEFFRNLGYNGRRR